MMMMFTPKRLQRGYTQNHESSTLKISNLVFEIRDFECLVGFNVFTGHLEFSNFCSIEIFRNYLYLYLIIILSRKISLLLFTSL
jgi:hypothetical protein